MSVKFNVGDEIHISNDWTRDTIDVRPFPATYLVTRTIDNVAVYFEDDIGYERLIGTDQVKLATHASECIDEQHELNDLLNLFDVIIQNCPDEFLHNLEETVERMSSAVNSELNKRNSVEATHYAKIDADEDELNSRIRQIVKEEFYFQGLNY